MSGRRHRGTALLAMLIVLFMASSVAATALIATPLIVRESGERVARTRARYIALGAAVRARAAIEEAAPRSEMTSAPGCSADLGWLEGAPDGSWFARTERLADGAYQVTAFARAGRVVEGVCQVVRSAATTASPFQVALTAGRSVQANGRIYADSYDSLLGAYATQSPLLGGVGGTRGSLRSNGSIDLDGGYVRGDAMPGPAGRYTSGGAVVTGSTAPAREVISLPRPAWRPPASNDNALLPVAPDADGALTVSAGTVRVPDGTFVLTRLRITGGVLDVGAATVFVSGSTEIQGTGAIRVRPGGKLRICVNGDVHLGGGGLVNQTGPTAWDPLRREMTVEGVPASAQIFSCAPRDSGARVRIDTGTPFYGAVYAPGADVRVAAGARIHGALVGDVIRTGAAAFHYDEALGRAAPAFDIQPRYDVIARWRMPR